MRHRGARRTQRLQQEDEDDRHDVEHRRDVEEVDLGLNRVAANGLAKLSLVRDDRRLLGSGSAPSRTCRLTHRGTPNWMFSNNASPDGVLRRASMTATTVWN